MRTTQGSAVSRSEAIMTHLSEHNLDWARHMIYSLRNDSGRAVSTTVRNRSIVEHDARQWIAGESWDQNNINEKSKQSKP